MYALTAFKKIFCNNYLVLCFFDLFYQICKEWDLMYLYEYDGIGSSIFFRFYDGTMYSYIISKISSIISFC